jgi:replicative DNA helicase
MRATTAPDEALPPPHSTHCELAILGTILSDGDAYSKVSGFLRPQHFYIPRNAKVFDVFSRMLSSGKRVDPVTVRPHLADIENLDDYFGELVSEAGTIVNAHDHGQLIFELALRRELIKIAAQMAETATAADLDFSPMQQIEEIERKLAEMKVSNDTDFDFRKMLKKKFLLLTIWKETSLRRRSSRASSVSASRLVGTASPEPRNLCWSKI